MKISLIFILLFTSYTSSAQLQCSDIFSVHKYLKGLREIETAYYKSIENSLERKRITYTKQKIEQELFERLTKYNFDLRSKARVNSLQQYPLIDGSKNLNPEELEHALRAYRFIDLPDIIRELQLVSKGESSLKYFKIKYGKKAFDNYLDAISYLDKYKPPFNLNTYKKLHSHLMKGGIDGMNKNQLGKFRQGGVYFGLDKTQPITNELKEHILKTNPYLTFVQSGRVKAGVYGEFYYPNVDDLSEILFKRLKKIDSDLYDDLSALKKVELQRTELETQIDATKVWGERRKLKKKLKLLIKQHAAHIKKYDKYNQRLIDALVKDNYEWYIQARSKLGELKSLADLRKFSDLTAKFHRNMISIHPFIDGNGRTTREFCLYYAFKSEGLIPPKLLYPDGDILLSEAEFQQIVWDGMLANLRLQDDVVFRIQRSLPLNESSHIFVPPPHDLVPVQKKTYSGKRSNTNQVKLLPANYFKAYFNNEFSRNRRLITQFEESFWETYSKLRENALKQYQLDHLIYDHPKRPPEFIGLEPVTDDFLYYYGKQTIHDKRLFDYKIKHWYEKDEVLWRGLADTEDIPTESEILDHFRVFTFHMASNNILNNASGTQQSLKSHALKDFKRYNEDLFDPEGAVVKMAKDHSETGPLYDSSYGYSTSKNRKVGKAFAMGAMVISDYGQQMKFQHLLKSRTLVGQLKSIKDIDLTTLKQIRPEFSYKYGRQQEVMGIGLADPEAIAIVQTLNEKGKVDLTYLRDLESPNLIHVIRGDAKIGTKPPKNKIIKTINLLE